MSAACKVPRRSKHTYGMGLYLALDVGGSKTAAVLADEERVLARAAGGSIKTMRVLPGEATRNLQELLATLERIAGVPFRREVTRTCVGTSGASATGVRAWLQAALSEAVTGELLLLGDEVIALDSAFQGRRGVLVIAGTGSNIVARAGTGAMVHTGGWGPALAEEGSGHWIGSEALRACFRAIDAARPSTADEVSANGLAVNVLREELPGLLVRVMDALGISTFADLIGTANAVEFQAARLVPVVAEAAAAGDALARETLERAGRDLADSVVRVVRKVEWLEEAAGRPTTPEVAPDPAYDVAYVGSVLTHINPVREAMFGSLGAQLAGVRLHPEPVDPLLGALWHARGRPGL